MSDVVVRVEELSKRYQLGHRQERYHSLRDAIAQSTKSLLFPLRSRAKRSQPSATEFWALKQVSFEVQRGDQIGIIGRNGAGKSTLLKILSRITEPTQGRIQIKGRVASLLEVGTGFHPELTGRENIFLNGAILGMSRVEIKRKFDEIVAFAEVEKFLDTPVKRYSSGMYVRLAFAVAAHLEPEILVVDEVLAVGDAQFQKKCLGKMGEVAQSGRTVFFVSHNMAAITALCNKAIYLAEGQLQAVGTADQIARLYLTKVLENKINDLRQLQLPNYGDQIQFTDIQLLNADTCLQVGQALRYQLTLESELRFEGLSIGSSIFNSNGQCVGTLFSDEFSMGTRSLTLELTVSNLNLAPDSYYVGFSVGYGQREGLRKDLDIVVGKPAFEIAIEQGDRLNTAVWQPSWGNVVFQDVHLSIRQAPEVLSYA